MKDSFERFVENCKKSIKYDPWVEERGFEGYVDEMHREIEEVKEAVEKGDLENLKEELGDVLLDWLHTVLLASQKYNFDEKEIIENVSEKLNRRKPYIAQERVVSKIDSKIMWQDAKRWEKSIR